MPSWRRHRFSDFVEINPTLRLQSENEYSFVEMKDLSASKKFALPSAKRTLSGGARFQNGDTLFARITPCLENGKICQVKGLENGVGFGSTEFLVFRGKDGISTNDFVFYLSRSDEVRKFGEKNMSGTSGRQRVNREAFDNLCLDLPPIEEQREITKILSSLDDKIELNRRMNATLEAMARALFKAWFVDFEPVHANKENRPSTSASPEIAKLFPSNFENGIPKSWEEKPLTEFFRLIGGGTPKTSVPEFWNGDIPWYSVVDAPNETDVFVIDTEKKITRAGLEGSSTRLLRKGVTIISARGTVGKLAIAGCEMAMNQSCYAVEGKFGDYFNFFVLKAAITELKQKTHGAVFDTITQNTFKAISQLLPAPEVIAAFENAVASTMCKIESNLEQNNTLMTIRDSLLPRLISGKLEIEFI